VAVILAVTTAESGGDGWESSPPRTPQQRPANGFEDRGPGVRHRPSVFAVVLTWGQIPGPSATVRVHPRTWLSCWLSQTAAVPHCFCSLLSMSDSTPALEALLAELTRNGSPLATYLQPGLSEAEIRSRMAAVEARPHADVIALYRWHNGFDRFRVPTSTNGMLSLVPYPPEFNPLDEPLEVFAQLRHFAETEAAIPHRHQGSWKSLDPDHIWSRAWFPIFQGGGSEVIFITSEQSDAGSVWLHPVQDAPRRLFDTLADAMDAVRMALVDGRLALDSKGIFTFESNQRARLLV
jgi:hypothetical protein